MGSVSKVKPFMNHEPEANTAYSLAYKTTPSKRPQNRVHISKVLIYERARSISKVMR